MAEFPKSYSAKESEEKWYDTWVEQGYFKAESNPAGKPYSIVIPPPNVTGSLHMGHALNATLQDVLVRWMRMKGRKALWLPGTDHAGIATQNVVERKLQSEDTDRHKTGREEFIRRIWQWKEEYGGRIIHQLKKLGASCDWSRERFTLDEGLSTAVREVFVRLYEDGLIYRATRLINWCPRCRTALSDLEVEHEDVEGTLTYIKYPLLDGKGDLTVATTRPETMLGDTAVAVNPGDDRYKEFVGKTIELPLTGRKIPVIADSEVDPEFGTGAVKITPAHDFNDEAVAKRQSPSLESITVIGETGNMTREASAKYEGMDRYACRRKVVEDLTEQGLLVKQDKHVHPIGHCYRCKTTVEPYSTPQWFVKTGPLAERAVEVVEKNNIRIIPEGWKNSYYSWMRDIRDWCITRQIWWGHRLPVWYCDECHEVIVSREEPRVCPECNSGNIRRDPDVLDTWFSSALWPFSTLGWPENTKDLEEFYPTSVLITGLDILFFWVARMIMMGMKFMQDVPFKDVYVHALVRDSEGRKMSKSKGNVIDPLLLIDKYGADAFRFTLAAFAAQGRDIKFDEQRVEGYKHFINKLWNATRFILMNIDDEKKLLPLEELIRKVETQRDEGSVSRRWILSRLAHTIEETDAALREYRFNDAANSIYQFTWHEFCDWYIEMSKTEISDLTKECLLYTLETVLRLLHPFMPFLTEDIWHRLPFKREGKSIMMSAYPEGIERDMGAEAEMGHIIEAVSGIRNIRGELNIAPAAVLDVFIKAHTPEAEKSLKDNVQYIEKLARAKAAEIGMNMEKPAGSYTSVKDNLEVYVKPAGLDVERELQRLGKERKKLEESMIFLQKKLQNEDFLRRAPEHIVQKEKKKLEELQGKREKIIESMDKLESLEKKLDN
jgi:valyl-tRNA synthetase